MSKAAERAAIIEELRAVQQDRCPICGREAPDSLDHNHATGEARGLLHKGCNAMLGYASDNPDVLEAAAAYLRNPPATGLAVHAPGQRLMERLLTIRLPDAQIAELKARAKASGMTMSQLIRETLGIDAPRRAVTPKPGKPRTERASVPDAPSVSPQSRAPISSASAQRQRDEWLRKVNKPPRERA